MIDRTKYMNNEEADRLRSCAEGQALSDLRAGRVKGGLAWMLIDFALCTGLRVSEIAAVKIEDIDFKRKAVKVTRLKRKKKAVETLAVDSKLIAHIKEYIEGRKSGHLFRGQKKGSRGNGDLKAQALQVIWKKAIIRAGLPKELSIHSARHTMAVHLLKKTGNLRQCQKQLGHTSSNTTARFYADISFEDMQAGVEGLYDSDAPSDR